MFAAPKFLCLYQHGFATTILMAGVGIVKRLQNLNGQLQMLGQIQSCDAHSINYSFKQSGDLRSKTICILTHGIFSEKSEKGRYERLSDLLNKVGLDTICFDFRGHGESKFYSEKFTLSGAINDLSAVLSAAEKNGYTTINLIASSFSSSIAILYNYLPQKLPIAKLALLNPVIDLNASALLAMQDDGAMIFNVATIEKIERFGRAKLSNGFTISNKFFHEICFIKPYEFIEALAMPIIVFHGTMDEKVDHKLSLTHFSQKQKCQIVLVENATHAFKNADDERRVFSELIAWISAG